VRAASLNRDAMPRWVNSTGFSGGPGRLTLGTLRTVPEVAFPIRPENGKSQPTMTVVTVTDIAYPN